MIKQDKNPETVDFHIIMLILVMAEVSYNKHMCVCVCACVRACMRNGRSPEVIRPLAKSYRFLWAMATVGQREGAQ